MSPTKHLRNGRLGRDRVFSQHQGGSAQNSFPVQAPLISVVVSTRNRGAGIVRTIETVLANEYPRFELLIVDQSGDDATEAAARPFLPDSRVCYVRAPGEGLAIARNLGIGRAQGELIAITDDDCDVATDWLSEMAAAFMPDDCIRLVFGNLLAGPHDPNAGFVMAYVRTEPFLARSIRDKHRVEGMSGNMGIKRSVWATLGGFDPALGAGARFKSASETDFAIRALLAGFFVYETPRVWVVHKGFRTWEDGLPQIQRYLYGIGAMLAKNLKFGHGSIVALMFHLAWRWAFRRPAADFGFIPPRGMRLAAFARGLTAGALAPIDRTSGHFASPWGPPETIASRETRNASPS